MALLFTVLTLVVPGSGALGLVTGVPMAAGAIGLAVQVWTGPRAPGADPQAGSA